MSNEDYNFYMKDLDKLVGIVNHYPCTMEDIVRLAQFMRHVMDRKMCTGEDAVTFIYCNSIRLI